MRFSAKSKFLKKHFSAKVFNEKFWFSAGLDILEVGGLFALYLAFLQMGKLLASSFLPPGFSSLSSLTPEILSQISPESVEKLYSLTLLSLALYLLLIFLLTAGMRYLAWKLLLGKRHSSPLFLKTLAVKALLLGFNLAMVLVFARILDSLIILRPASPIIFQAALFFLLPWIASANMGLVAFAIKHDSIKKAFSTVWKIWSKPVILWKWYLTAVAVFALLSIFSLTFKLLPQPATYIMSFVLFFAFVSWARIFTLNYLFKKA